MARMVKLLFGWGPAKRDAAPALERGRATAPVDQSAADQRTPTVRGVALSATAGSASS